MGSVGGLIGGLLGTLEALGPSVLSLLIGSELANQATRPTCLAFGLLGTLPLFAVLGLIFGIGIGFVLFVSFAVLVGVLAGVREAIEAEVKRRNR